MHCVNNAYLVHRRMHVDAVDGFVRWLDSSRIRSCVAVVFGTRRAFPVGGLQAGKRGQGRVNPGETCFPAYSGELVLRKTSVSLGPRVLGR